MSKLGKSFPVNVDKLKSELGGNGGGFVEAFIVNYVLSSDPMTGDLFIDDYDKNFDEILAAIENNELVEVRCGYDSRPYIGQLIYSDSSGINFAIYLPDFTTGNPALYMISHDSRNIASVNPMPSGSSGGTDPLYCHIVYDEGQYRLDITAQEAYDALVSRRQIIVLGEEGNTDMYMYPAVRIAYYPMNGDPEQGWVIQVGFIISYSLQVGRDAQPIMNLYETNLDAFPDGYLWQVDVMY